MEQKYFINRIVNEKTSPHEVETRCYPFTMDDVKLFAHRDVNNPKFWNVTESSTGACVTTLYHNTKKNAIEECEDIIRSKPGWLQKCIANAPKLFATSTSVVVPDEVIPLKPIVDCTQCIHTNCHLKDGFFDLCDGTKHKQKETPSVSHDQRTAQAGQELRAALNEWNVKYGKNSHNFEWEAEMDCLMAPPTPEQLPEESGRSVEVYDYVPSGDKIKKVVIGHAELVPLERQEFPSKTIFPPEFPTPVVCKEFCEKNKNCHLREQGINDLCKNNSRFGKLVHPVDQKWSAWNDFHNRLPKIEFVHSTRTGTAPEIALAHWGSPDAQMNDGDGNGDDEYISPQEQAREIGDKDAIRFIPAYIFRSGKPQWKAVTAFDKQGYPYRKMVKYPSIRPIACRVELYNGYVIPAGKAGSSLKITTRADKKRMYAYSAIRKELTAYVGAERAGKMAGQQVAAMATC